MLELGTPVVSAGELDAGCPDVLAVPVVVGFPEPGDVEPDDGAGDDEPGEALCDGPADGVADGAGVLLGADALVAGARCGRGAMLVLDTGRMRK